jgi:Fe-S-cluster containining protein
VPRHLKVHYDCTECPAFCCSVYERVAVTDADLARLARHFGLSLGAAEKKFTRRWQKERILRRRKDDLFGQACRFLDAETRGCGIYEARPAICRQYPAKPRCGYFDLMKFERDQQGDPEVLPIVKLEFHDLGDLREKREKRILAIKKAATAPKGRPAKRAAARG